MLLLLLLGAWMVASFRVPSKVLRLCSHQRPLLRVLRISPSDEDNVMNTADQGRGTRTPLAKGFGQSSTLGADSTVDENPSQSGRTRSEKKAEYRKLASMAKRSSSLHKMLGGGAGTDIFQAQRKQGNRGSGGA